MGGYEDIWAFFRLAVVGSIGFYKAVRRVSRRVWRQPPETSLHGNVLEDRWREGGVRRYH